MERTTTASAIVLETIERLWSALDACQQRNADLEAELDDMKSQNTILSKKLLLSEQKEVSLKKENEQKDLNLLAYHNYYKPTIQRLSNDLDACKQRNTTLEAEITEKERENGVVKAALESSSAEILRLDKSLRGCRSLEGEIMDLTTMLQEQKNRTQLLEKQLMELEKKATVYYTGTQGSGDFDQLDNDKLCIMPTFFESSFERLLRTIQLREYRDSIQKLFDAQYALSSPEYAEEQEASELRASLAMRLTRIDDLLANLYRIRDEIYHDFDGDEYDDDDSDDGYYDSYLDVNEEQYTEDEDVTEEGAEYTDDDLDESEAEDEDEEASSDAQMIGIEESVIVDVVETLKKSWRKMRKTWTTCEELENECAPERLHVRRHKHNYYKRHKEREYIEDTFADMLESHRTKPKTWKETNKRRRLYKSWTTCTMPAVW
uniref:Protein CASP n=1 Tax=Steinernema glaseri TaxID=37863 RepID=A0A1I7Y8M3_9BILA